MHNLLPRLLMLLILHLLKDNKITTKQWVLLIQISNMLIQFNSINIWTNKMIKKMKQRNKVKKNNKNE